MIHANMTNDEYHASPAVSRSGIMEFKKSPYHYFKAYLSEDKVKKEQTPAMIFGSAFHTYMLEPNKFDNEYCVEPERVLLKDVGREKYEDYKKLIELIEKQNKIVITQKDKELILSMEKSVLEHPEASNLITGGMNEASIFWTDEHTGIECKSKPDIWFDDIVVDLKTISSADPHTFQRSIVDGGYHIQAAMIRNGIKANTGKDVKNFAYIVCEKSFPYAVAVYVLDEFALDKGHCEYKDMLLQLKNCKQTNTWQSYQTQTISLPGWYK